MQLRHWKAIQNPHETIVRVTAMCWSPNNRRLAVCSTDRIVLLYDETGTRQDKFATKPAEAKGPKNYIIRQMCFSPDSTKLAIAQSDCIVFVYKLGSEWGEKKSICNKFIKQSPITCLAWPMAHPDKLVFGTAEGKVHVGHIKTNKPQSLYGYDSYVVSCCSNTDGTGILTGHLDGSIYMWIFPAPGDPASAPVHRKLQQHTCPPYALSWGECVVAAGNDCKVVMYDLEGQVLALYDYNQDGQANEKEFTVASFNPTGESCVVGSFNRFRIYAFNKRSGFQGSWDEVAVREVPNLYTVTALAWKFDGSRLVTGSLTGAVDMYDACVRRYKHKGKFEFTYVSTSQVIVKRLTSGTRIVLKSHFAYEILKINIYHDRYLVAYTPDTLLLGDLETCKLSEVPWNGSGGEKFFFENENVCMVFNAGELTLVEYGHNEVLGSCRTEFMNPHLISVRLANGAGGQLNDSGESVNAYGQESTDVKTIAYLMDLQTIRLIDLTSSVPIATINHECKVDWLELNPAATKLLFRDKRRELHLFDIDTLTRSTLLTYCNYVQWVPDSDVVVAQNRSSLCVWYSIDAPERVTVFPIKGEVEDIERSQGRTEVIVDEGINTVSYALDESLIEFGTAVREKQYDRAVELLEQLELTPETEALWTQLSELALNDNELNHAERCFAALGDVSKARYLYRLNKVATQMAAEYGGGNGYNHYHVRAMLCILNKRFKQAENILLEQGGQPGLSFAMEMYQQMHQWDDLLALVEAREVDALPELQAQYLKHLTETGQEDKAAELKERNGEYETAIYLYLRANQPARAANVVTNSDAMFASFSPEVLEKIAKSLKKMQLFEKAGSFYESIASHSRDEKKQVHEEYAMDMYVKGKAYRHAVELARRVAPSHVVRLEEEWGDYLSEQKQLDAAINHYVEAGHYVKGIKAAIAAKQWTKAVSLVDTQDPEVAKPYYRQIAQHYDNMQRYEEAERFYCRGGTPQLAVKMHIGNHAFDKARRVAQANMATHDVNELYLKLGHEAETSGRLKEAEKLYLTVNEEDLAITMYKKHHQFDDMVRLVAQYRKEHLTQTHLYLAEQLKGEQNYKAAEHHYVQAGPEHFNTAVNMYMVIEMWDEAIRVTKVHGGVAAANEVAYTCALSLGGEAGAKLLTKLGLVDQAIEYAMDTNSYDQAFKLAQSNLKSKLPDVHFKFAMHLEDIGRFKEAEEEFIKAKKPKEAIDMYIHQQDWGNAQRVADDYDPGSAGDIPLAQARVKVEAKDYQRAEELFIAAHKPELAVKAYKDSQQWTEALRVTKEHMDTRRYNELLAEYQRFQSGGGETGTEIVQEARRLEGEGQYNEAVDAYLQVTRTTTADLDHLERLWFSAVNLTINHIPARLAEVAKKVTDRLMEIGRYDQAAELYEGIDYYKQALEVYAKGALWDKARQLAAQAGPQYSKYVQELYVQHLQQNEDAGELLNEDEGAAIEIFVKRGEWDSVFEAARRQGPAVLNSYTLRYAAVLANDQQNPNAAVQALVQANSPYVPGQLVVYNRIARDVLAKGYPVGNDDAFDQCCNVLKQCLLSLHTQMQTTAVSDSEDQVKETKQLLWIAHLVSTRAVCIEKGMDDFAAKIACALCRYVGIIPADKTFYQAGVACMERYKATDEGAWRSQGFLLLNRFLDLADMLQGESPDEDNSDFVDSDIPFQFTPPTSHWVGEDTREEIREENLTLAMEGDMEIELRTAPCPNCNADIWEACAVCPKCNHRMDLCVVTGHPVLSLPKFTYEQTNMPANKEDWNEFVRRDKRDPWSLQSALPNF